MWASRAVARPSALSSSGGRERASNSSARAASSRPAVDSPRIRASASVESNVDRRDSVGATTVSVMDTLFLEEVGPMWHPFRNGSG